MVDKLLSFDPPTLKLATFSLRTLIKERAFLTEFLRHGGVDALQEVIKQSSGNTLAYALGGMQSLMEVEDRGWEGLEDGFVSRIVEIIGALPLILALIVAHYSSRGPIDSYAASHQHLSAIPHHSPSPLVTVSSDLIRRLGFHRQLPLTPPYTPGATFLGLLGSVESGRVSACRCKRVPQGRSGQAGEQWRYRGGPSGDGAHQQPLWRGYRGARSQVWR